MTTTGMQRWCRTVLGACVMLAGATSAGAQAQTPATAPPAPSDATRPATTTFLGDTGLWYVPTGEVLPAKRKSFSALLRERRSRSRLHRHRALHRHVRLRRRRSHRAVPVDGSRLAHRPRLPSGRLRRQPGRRPGQRISDHAERLVRLDVRRYLRRRQVQPPVRVRPERRRPRHPRHREAAHRQHRRRQGHVDGQGRFHRRRDRQQGNQQGVRAVRLRRVCVPWLSRPEGQRRGRGDLERWTVGLRLRRADARADSA